jgi:5-methylcytosine-specific restriction endonuclease McrA
MRQVAAISQRLAQRGGVNHEPPAFNVIRRAAPIDQPSEAVARRQRLALAAAAARAEADSRNAKRAAVVEAKKAAAAIKKAAAAERKAAKLAYIQEYGAPLVVQTFAKIRPLILDRDDYCCQICRADAGCKSLHVHHIDRSRLNNKGTNLITLCEPCHRAVHADGYYPGGLHWDDGSAWGGTPKDVGSQ